MGRRWKGGSGSHGGHGGRHAGDGFGRSPWRVLRGALRRVRLEGHVGDGGRRVQRYGFRSRQGEWQEGDERRVAPDRPDRVTAASLVSGQSCNVVCESVPFALRIGLVLQDGQKGDGRSREVV